MMALWTSVQSSAHLLSISVADNPITAAGAKRIGTALIANHTLTSVDVASLHFGDRVRNRCDQYLHFFLRRLAV
jgi:hypothetical protein